MKQQPVFTEQFDGIPFPFGLSLSYSTKRGDKVVVLGFGFPMEEERQTQKSENGGK